MNLTRTLRQTIAFFAILWSMTAAIIIGPWAIGCWMQDIPILPVPSFDCYMFVAGLGAMAFGGFFCIGFLVVMLCGIAYYLANMIP